MMMMMSLSARSRPPDSHSCFSTAESHTNTHLLLSLDETKYCWVLVEFLPDQLDPPGGHRGPTGAAGQPQQLLGCLGTIEPGTSCRWAEPGGLSIDCCFGWNPGRALQRRNLFTLDELLQTCGHLVNFYKVPKPSSVRHSSPWRPLLYSYTWLDGPGL